jgi:hypothetical protein
MRLIFKGGGFKLEGKILNSNRSGVGLKSYSESTSLPLSININVGLRQLLIKLKGLVEYFEQFDVLLGEHQTVAQNTIIEDTETGFGRAGSDPLNLHHIKFIRHISNALVKINDMLIVGNSFFIEGVLNLFEDVKDNDFDFFEFFDLDIQEPFMPVAGVDIGAKYDIPMSIGQLLKPSDGLGIFERDMRLLFLQKAQYLENICHDDIGPDLDLFDFLALTIQCIDILLKQGVKCHIQ